MSLGKLGMSSSSSSMNDSSDLELLNIVQIWEEQQQHRWESLSLVSSDESGVEEVEGSVHLFEGVDRQEFRLHESGYKGDSWSMSLPSEFDDSMDRPLFTSTPVYDGDDGADDDDDDDMVNDGDDEMDDEDDDNDDNDDDSNGFDDDNSGEEFGYKDDGNNHSDFGDENGDEIGDENNNDPDIVDENNTRFNNDEITVIPESDLDDESSQSDDGDDVDEDNGFDNDDGDSGDELIDEKNNDPIDQNSSNIELNGGEITEIPETDLNDDDDDDADDDNDDDKPNDEFDIESDKKDDQIDDIPETDDSANGVVDSTNQSVHLSSDSTHDDEICSDAASKLISSDNNQVGGSKPLYTISKLQSKYIKKYKTDRDTWKVKFHVEDVDPSDLHKVMVKNFNELIDRVADDLNGNDKMRFVFMHPALDRPINLPLVNREDIDAEMIISEIEKVIESNQGFEIDEEFEMDVMKIRMPSGSGYLNRNQPLQKVLKDKRSVLAIKSEDSCLARALVVAIAKVTADPAWTTIKDSRCVLQKQKAEELCHLAGVPVGKQCGIPEIKNFQNVLQEFQIIVLCKEYMNAIIYSGPIELEKRLYLYLHDKHFDVITTITGFLNKSYYCIRCEKGYKSRTEHKCDLKCRDCYQNSCNASKENRMNRVMCSDCHRSFGNLQCYNAHIQKPPKGKTICEQVQKCTKCFKTVRSWKADNHHCGQLMCLTCQTWYEYGTSHQCFMMPVKGKTQVLHGDDNDDMMLMDSMIGDEEKVEETKIFYFDCEADNAMTHKCNCVCVKTREGNDSKVFYGDQAISDFIEWVLTLRNACFLAHNFSGYDSYLVLKGLTDEAICPTVVPRGGKILALSIAANKVKFIDSYSFVPVALRKLPATFGFDTSILKKGDFPHKFNRPENWNYNGPMPDKTWWIPEAMKDDDREKFESWHNDLTQQGYVFNFKQELIDYCMNDVEVLRRCMNVFQQEFIDNSGVDPFESCITIASACMTVFRQNFLKENTIAIIPGHGLKKPTHSVKSIQWLLYQEYISGHTLQHARNGEEKKIGSFHLDGWCEETGEGYEFMGCFWHGCPKCYSRKTVNSLKGCTMGELYDQTTERLEKIHAKVKVQVMWEHDWDLQVKENPEILNFVNGMDIKQPLQPKDAFYGGRTEAISCYYEPSQGETVQYLDVMSLYPYINKYGVYPVGFPNILVGSEITQDLDMYFGLARVKILPPTQLYTPVLPYRWQGKLYFPLCRSCVQTQCVQCTHSEEERMLEGTFVIQELELALQKGYTLLEIEEVWHWEEKSRVLFADYVNTFLALKIESSGWPDHVKTVSDQEEYVQEIREKENVSIDPSRVERNMGKRYVAKLCLNSFWGKFAQSPYVTQSTIVSEPNDFFQLLSCDKEDIQEILFLNDEIVEIKHKQRTEFVAPLATGNTVIAAFTTAQARMKLYSSLDIVKERILYMDTDSLIFISNRQDEDPPVGNTLGDLQNELEEEEFIQQFYSGGAKNYGFRTNRGKVSLKVRGFTLNKLAQSSLKLDRLIDNVLDGTFEKTSIDVHMGDTIRRRWRQRELVTVPNKKVYRVVFNKRILDRNTFKSLPFGYIGDK